MAGEATRLQTWDEEDKLLGPPITMPELPKKDGKAQAWEVFLRLPRGVDTTPKTQQNSALALLYGGQLAQYVCGYRTGVLNVYLAVAVEPKNFASTVIGHFPVSGGSDVPVTIPRSVILLGTAKGLTPEIAVRRRSIDGQLASYSFNFYEHEKVQVAVVYEIDKGNGTKADAAIKASLASLGEGTDDVLALHKTYERTNRKPKR